MAASDLFSFNRTISGRLSAMLVRTPLKPNHITALSVLSGAAGAYCATFGTRRGLLAAALFLHLRFILDNCDGALARAKGLSSTFGMWFDLTGDIMVDILFWWGLACGAHLHIRGELPWVLAGAATAGSLIHFGFVLRERLGSLTDAAGAPGKRNTMLEVLYALNHDGDPSLLVWLFAFVGDPLLLLVMGGLYMHALWLSQLAFSRHMAWRL